MLLFGLGLGFYGGVAATKRAITSPPWVRGIFGFDPRLTGPSAPVAPAPPVQPAAAPAAASSAPLAAVPSAPGATDNPQSPGTTDHVLKPGKQTAADPRDLVGTWTVTDQIGGADSGSSTMTTSYTLRSDNTGEYDSNGKKLYELKWKPDGDDLSLDFDGTGPDANQPWSAKLKWSLNDDKSVLTLVPEEGKDPRSFVYSLGPGVYRKKQ
jgi:hypothetical protein